MTYQDHSNNTREPEGTLRRESISTKIIVQSIIFLVVVILAPAFHVELPHHFGLSWNIGLALIFALSFFLIHKRRKRKELLMRNIYIAENIVDTLMLSHLLFLFGHINGVLFFFYGFVIMEAALNLDRIIPFFIASTAAMAMLTEFFFLISRGEIVLGLNSVLFAILRMVFLFLMARYSHTLSNVVVEAKNKTKQIEKQSKQLGGALAELQTLDKAKSEFISIASHQLRTPLTAIKGYVSLMIEGDYGKLSKGALQSMKNVYLANERLVKLVNSLLDMSRLEAGKITLDFVPVKIDYLVADILRELRGEAESKNLKLRMDKDRTNLPKIEADPAKLRDVLMNLIDNAIKYTNKGEVAVKIKYDSFVGNIEIIVQDTGEGMAQEEIDKLFQSFSRADSGKKNWSEGSGLGLYIAKKFIEIHHGTIHAESQGKGLGSQFIIELPIVQPNNGVDTRK